MQDDAGDNRYGSGVPVRARQPHRPRPPPGAVPESAPDELTASAPDGCRSLQTRQHVAEPERPVARAFDAHVGLPFRDVPGAVKVPVDVDGRYRPSPERCVCERDRVERCGAPAAQCRFVRPARSSSSVCPTSWLPMTRICGPGRCPVLTPRVVGQMEVAPDPGSLGVRRDRSGRWAGGEDAGRAAAAPAHRRDALGLGKPSSFLIMKSVIKNASALL